MSLVSNFIVLIVLFSRFLSFCRPRPPAAPVVSLFSRGSRRVLVFSQLPSCPRPLAALVFFSLINVLLVTCVLCLLLIFRFQSGNRCSQLGNQRVIYLKSILVTAPVRPYKIASLFLSSQRVMIGLCVVIVVSTKCRSNPSDFKIPTSILNIPGNTFDPIFFYNLERSVTD